MFCYRFPETEATVKFSVLGMRPVHCLGPQELQAWGNAEIQSLAQLYGSEQTHQHKDEVYRSAPYIHASVEAVFEEWQMCKTTVTTLKYTIAKLADFWQILARFHAEEFPNLIKLAYLAVTHPVHSCECERTFSVQNLTLTSLRSRFSIEHCDQLMRVHLEGGSLDEFDFKLALKTWREHCHRKIFAN